VVAGWVRRSRQQAASSSACDPTALVSRCGGATATRSDGCQPDSLTSMKVGLDIAVVLLLVLIEAVFVATEISLVSLRDSQVRGLAAKGRRGAAVARLTADPNRFLAGVQIGVTLTSLLSSAYGAVPLSASPP